MPILRSLPTGNRSLTPPASRGHTTPSQTAQCSAPLPPPLLSLGQMTTLLQTSISSSMKWKLYESTHSTGFLGGLNEFNALQQLARSFAPGKTLLHSCF